MPHHCQIARNKPMWYWLPYTRCPFRPLGMAGEHAPTHNHWLRHSLLICAKGWWRMPQPGNISSIETSISHVALLLASNRNPLRVAQEMGYLLYTIVVSLSSTQKPPSRGPSSIAYYLLCRILLAPEPGFFSSTCRTPGREWWPHHYFVLSSRN